MRLETFQPKDIILKQEASNDRVFFIINGIVEVIDEQKDYEFYDYNVMGKSIIFLYTIDKYYSVMHNEEILLSTHQSFKINKSMPSERATTRKC
jgi:signal-transduction protein with cAMP-binding, CBS, and nucleotidyltransferase domain